MLSCHVTGEDLWKFIDTQAFINQFMVRDNNKIYLFYPSLSINEMLVWKDVNKITFVRVKS